MGVTMYTKPPTRIVPQPVVDISEHVLVTPTQNKYVKYAHRVCDKVTRCGIPILEGFLWKALDAVIIQADWCAECWEDMCEG